MPANKTSLSKSSLSEQENEANLFAMYLLMPELMVREFCRKNHIKDVTDDRQVKRVATAFGVPVGMAAIRLKELVT